MSSRIISSTAFRIAFGYFVVASLWIIFSDNLVNFLFDDPIIILQLSLLKGWLFVGLTAFLLFVLISRHVVKIEDTVERLTVSNLNLTSTKAELTDKQRELNRRFAELEQASGRIAGQNHILEMIHKTTLVLMNRLDINEVLRELAVRTGELVGTENTFIYVWNTELGNYERKIGTGIYAGDIGRIITKDNGFIVEAENAVRPLVIEDYAKWEKRNAEPFFDNIHSLVYMPLKSEMVLVGWLGAAFTDSGRLFNDNDVALIERLAELASIALDNATLYTASQRELAERRQAEESLLVASEEYKALLNAIPDLIFVVDRDGVFLDYKAEDTNDLLVSPANFLGRRITDVMPPDLAYEFMWRIAALLEQGGVQFCEYQLTVAGKDDYYEARFMNGGINRIVIIVRNITNDKHLQRQLEDLSLKDSLTGLYNRSYFREEMTRVGRQKSLPAGFIICDVDGLNLINNSLGQGAGDDLLRAVAAILQECSSSGEIVARVGGDEFAILTLKETEEQVQKACHRIKEAVNVFNADNPQMPLSLSIGFSLTAGRDVDIDAVYKEANTNMQREKLHRGQSSRSAIVQTLTKALEARDFITEGHADRMSDIAEALAVKIGLPERVLADIRLLAQFHDIGKVGIPDSILFKAGPLTPEERVIMRRHPEIGYRIAKASKDLEPIAEWILKHHEWWDGNGYPYGAKREEIPIQCRILAIADAFDAMTNDRPYRKALSVKEAVSELKRFSGIQFDPELIEAFESLLESLDLQTH